MQLSSNYNVILATQLLYQSSCYGVTLAMGISLTVATHMNFMHAINFYKILFSYCLKSSSIDREIVNSLNN